MATPKLPDNQTRSQMLPNSGDGQTPIKDAIKKMLRINDEQIALNRYKWYNLPPGLTGQEIERVLYYRGEGMFFYIPETRQWEFLPYTLDGGGSSLDFHGRWLRVHPLPFMGTGNDSKTVQNVILSNMKREPLYDISSGEDLEHDLETKCVLVHDYARQLSQTVLPRQKVNEEIIDIESNIIPYINTLLSNSTGVSGMRVNDGDEQASVELASQTANMAALNGKRWIAIRSPLELQDLSSVAGGRAEDMLMAMQSIDNIRLGTYGVENGGIFEKKAHMLNAEAAMNVGSSSLVMDDGLYQRQTACVILASIAPFGTWCEINETAAGYDRNFDGMIGGEPDTVPLQTAGQGGGATDGND